MAKYKIEVEVEMMVEDKGVVVTRIEELLKELPMSNTLSVTAVKHKSKKGEAPELYLQNADPGERSFKDIFTDLCEDENYLMPSDLSMLVIQSFCKFVIDNKANKKLVQSIEPSDNVTRIFIKDSMPTSLQDKYFEAAYKEYGIIFMSKVRNNLTKILFKFIKEKCPMFVHKNEGDTLTHFAIR